MKLRPIFTLLFVLCVLNPLISQSIISGKVVDENDEALLAVNIYLKSDITNGTASNMSGDFRIVSISDEDTLVASFLGYKTEYIVLRNLDEDLLKINLVPAKLNLDQVTIMATDPISEEFAISKLEKLDIYFDPFAQGDALRAVSTSPYATTTDESANPSLRGSSAERSIVYFNGVPIYNPVRNSQINGIGNFSIFNTELVDNQYIYPSNPPLTYGNTSAGVVAIESTRAIESDEFQVSLTLAGVGVLASKKLSDGKFVQGFSNRQFSRPFSTVNKKSTKTLNSFGSSDAGINFHADLGNWDYNGFGYFIDEFYDVNINQFSYESQALATNRRFYTVQNLSRLFSSGKLSIDLGYNTSSSDFAFGNLYTKRRNQEFYGSARYKHFFQQNLSVEGGIAYDQQAISFADSIPNYYYALSSDSPNFHSATRTSLRLPEAFVYLRKKIDRRWKMHFGLRSNLDQTAYQTGLTYKHGNSSRVILSAGNYYSFTRPNYNGRSFEPLTSKQIALDYIYQAGKLKLQSAFYLKRETGQRSFDFFFPVEAVNTLGIELYLDWNFHRFWNFTFSNNYIDQKQLIFRESYPGRYDFNYFIKSSLTFKHPRIATIILSYIGRPGGRYNEIEGGNYDPITNFYIPQFTNQIYGGNFNSYRRLDLAISKYLAFDNQSLICFLSIANILDFANQQSPVYNQDYSQETFTNFQGRSVFFGLVWSKRRF